MSGRGANGHSPAEADVPKHEDAAVVGCTIIARNYLSHASILALSYLDHMPGSRFYILVVDGLPDGARLPAGVRLIDLEELGLVDVFEMSFKYDVTELSTAVKAMLLRVLFDRYGESKVVYLDPDILIFRRMSELEAALGRADIVLTPHTMVPIPLDGEKPSEQDILIAGAYNLGFIALREGQVARRFLTWWAERLRDLCRVDTAGGLMVDQRWIDLVPSFFDSVELLKDETYNVAYWNLHSRTIGKDGEEYTVNGRPLTFFHFSGFDPRTPGLVSRHQTRSHLDSGTDLAELFSLYCQRQEENGFWESSQWPYGLAQFDNGVALDRWMRQLYLKLGEDERRRFGNPFETRHDESFFSWATKPVEDRLGLSPFVELIYSVRYDVAAAFPHPAGPDRQRLLEWATTQGAFEMGYDWRLADAEESARLMRPHRPAAVNTGLPPGVNVCGYLSDESGLGSAARGYVRGLRAAGVPVALRDVSVLSVNRSEAGEFPPHNEHPHDVNLICVNADQHFLVMSQDPAFFQGRYNIGIWAWELSRFPREWHNRFRYYDELWVGSSFIANALAPVSPIPVIRIPPALAAPVDASRQRGRRLMRARAGETIFLFIFDFHSYGERKNPMAVLEAFLQAFKPDEPARLVLKCVNPKADRGGFDSLEAQRGSARVTILSDYMPRRSMADLMAGCDCYVSLHRSEGTGLTLMEAMAAGRPTIATDWSGNTDFMDSTNSYPVPYQLVELDRDIGPYRRGEVWAEPSVPEAAEIMRYVFEHPREAAAKGRAARQAMQAYTEEAVALEIAARLRSVELRRRSVGLPVRELPAAYSGNGPILQPIRDAVEELVTEDATVIVISRGDEALLDLRGRTGWHFPQTDDGVYAGFYPDGSETAIAHLEALRAKGAGYLLVPQTSGWWLRHYTGFREYLDQRYELLQTNVACVLYRLTPTAIHSSPAEGNGAFQAITETVDFTALQPPSDREPGDADANGRGQRNGVRHDVAGDLRSPAEQSPAGGLSRLRKAIRRLAEPSRRPGRRGDSP